jgi:hypothetical protein
MAKLLGAGLVLLVFYVAPTAIVVYVGWHFISKFW